MRSRSVAVTTVLGLVAGLLAVSPSTALAAASPPIPAGGRFVSLTPQRLVDTRDGLGADDGPTTALVVDGTPALRASGQPQVSALQLDVTVTDASGPGFVTAWGHLTTRPTTSVLSFVPGSTVATFVLAQVGSDQAVSLALSSPADVVVDLVGVVTAPQYLDVPDVSPASTFTPVTPTRLADTRNGTGIASSLRAGQARTLSVAGRAGVPRDATAVAVNLTAARATAPGFLTAWPAGTARPTTSSLNTDPHQIRANRALVQLGRGGAVSLFANAGLTDVVVDVVGYTSTSTTGALYVPVTPTRLADQRGTGFDLTVTGDLPFRGVAAPLPSARALSPTVAVWASLTADHPAGPGYVAAAATGVGTSTSDVNLVPGGAVSNGAVVRVSTAPSSVGGISIRSSVPTRLVVDLLGYFVGAPRRDALAGSNYAFLDDATATPSVVAPTPVPPSVVDIASDAVWLADGTVHRFTRDAGYGMTIGDPVETDAGTPLTGVTAFGGGVWSHYAVDGAGQLWSWGDNDGGQLGRSPSWTPDPVARRVAGLPGPVARVFGMPDLAVAVLRDGRTFAWGNDGDIENGVSTDHAAPVQVTGLGSRPVSVDSDGSWTYAALADGSVVRWSASWWVHNPAPVAASMGVTGSQVIVLEGWVWLLRGNPVLIVKDGDPVSPSMGYAQTSVPVRQLAPSSSTYPRALFTDGTVGDPYQLRGPDGTPITGNYDLLHVPGLTGVARLTLFSGDPVWPAAGP